MNLECPVHHVKEEIELPTGGNRVRFSCGHECELTTEDLRDLFRRYGGER